MSEFWEAAAAFAALEAIQSGEWDRYLLRLRAAINERMKTEGYRDHIVVGTVLRDGVQP